MFSPPRRTILGAALVALSPFLVLGCSDKSSDANVTTTLPTRAPSVVVSPTPESTVAGVQAPDTKYRQYVATVCTATASFQSDLSKFATADFAKQIVSDPNTAFSDVATVFDQYSTALKKADPPQELQTWQTDAVSRIDAAASALRTRDQGELARIFQSKLPSIPAGAQDKLKAAAQDEKECDRANLFK